MTWWNRKDTVVQITPSEEEVIQIIQEAANAIIDIRDSLRSIAIILAKIRQDMLDERS